MRNKDTRGLAAEAAAIIAEGVPDWSEARRKLAEEYEITSGAQLPGRRRDRIGAQGALCDFRARTGHAERLLELRKAALIVMREVSDCQTLLIRGVLNGCADKYSDIYIAVECDDAKSLEIVLIDREIEIEVFPNDGPERTNPSKRSFLRLRSSEAAILIANT